MIRQKLQLLLNEKENERRNYGMIFNYNMGNTDKGTLLYTISNKYGKLFNDSLNGNIVNEEELCGGAKINHLLELFKKTLIQMSPLQDLSDNDLSVAIRNVSGLSSSLTLSDKAFEVLIKRQVQKLIKPSFECITMVYNELRTILSNIKVQELEFLHKAREAMLRTAGEILQGCLLPAESMLTNIFKIEIGYINTRHPDFIYQKEQLVMELNRTNSAHKVQRRDEDEGFFAGIFGSSKSRAVEAAHDAGMPSKEEINFIKGLISIYFSIVRKNLIDYVPKTSAERVDKELFTALNSQYRADDILSVDQNSHEKFKELELNIAALHKCKTILDEFDRIKLLVSHG